MNGHVPTIGDRRADPNLLAQISANRELVMFQHRVTAIVEANKMFLAGTATMPDLLARAALIFEWLQTGGISQADVVGQAPGHA